MKHGELYNTLVRDSASGRKKLAVLLDPDKCSDDFLTTVTDYSMAAGIDYFFIGGSLLMNDQPERVIGHIRKHSEIPVLLFPGNNLQVNDQADGILLLSLISGRNPELLIGRHVIAAPFLKASRLEIIPTGYMLVESGTMTTAVYMSSSLPIPAGKSDIAVCTALAGEMLGMKMIYLDAGSGAGNPVPTAMIHAVRSAIGIPLIIGGGVVTAQNARQAFEAGADLVVVGNIVERDPSMIAELAAARQ